MLTDLLTHTQVGTGWVSHVHEQGKEAAAARGEAPLQEAPPLALTPLCYLLPTDYLPLTAYYLLLTHLLLTAYGSRLTACYLLPCSTDY